MAGVQLTNFNIFEQKLKIESKRHSMKNKLLMEQEKTTHTNKYYFLDCVYLYTAYNNYIIQHNVLLSAIRSPAFSQCAPDQKMHKFSCFYRIIILVCMCRANSTNIKIIIQCTYQNQVKLITHNIQNVLFTCICGIFTISKIINKTLDSKYQQASI